MKRHILPIILCLVFSLETVTAQSSNTSNNKCASQQSYKSGIGLRLGVNDENHGFSYKHFIDAIYSYEILFLSDFSTGIEIQGLYQYNGNFPDFPTSFGWFAGGGGQIGTWKNDEITFGINGMLGIGYTFSEIPLRLDFDWHPVLNVVTKGTIFMPARLGFTIRYIVR